MGRFNHWYDYLNPLNYYRTISDNLQDGYQFGDLSKGILGVSSSASDIAYDTLNNHGLDSSGNIEISPADPTSSASNVISYDPNKTALQNMYDYAVQNNSASAYSAWLENKFTEEMSNSSIQRAIADAEASGISKYQLFQSGNAGASVPSAAGTLSTSYENAMNRRESWNEKELAAITKIVATTISSAFSLLKK